MVKMLDDAGGSSEHVKGQWQMMGLNPNPLCPVFLDFINATIEEDYHFSIEVGDSTIGETNIEDFLQLGELSVKKQSW